MSLPGFYDDNTGRAYPLIPFSNVSLGQTAPAIPPPDTLIDFGCLVGLDAEFDSSQNIVYLHQIIRVGDTFTFDFRSDAPGLWEYALRFQRDLTDVEYTTDYAEAVQVGSPDAPDGLQVPLWEGFLVTGPMDSLAALMPTDGAVTTNTGPQIEPALVQNLGQSYLRTINLANQDRTRVAPPSNCIGGDAPAVEAPYIVNARGLVGDIRFKEGFNLSIRQTARNNSLAFAASKGAGAGVPCPDSEHPNGEVPLYPGELPPEGSILLSGGPACDEVVNSINGLTSSTIRLVADLGTQITPSADNTALVVNFDRNNMTVCGAVEVVVEELGDG